MSFKKVFEWEHFKGIERSCEIRHNRWQIIHDNMTPWQYYKWDKQDLYNMINFDNVYMNKRYEWNIDKLFNSLYARLLKWWVIKKFDPWEKIKKREEWKWKSVVTEILNLKKT